MDDPYPYFVALSPLSCYFGSFECKIIERFGMSDIPKKPFQSYMRPTSIGQRLKVDRQESPGDGKEKHNIDEAKLKYLICILSNLIRKRELGAILKLESTTRSKAQRQKTGAKMLYFTLRNKFGRTVSHGFSSMKKQKTRTKFHHSGIKSLHRTQKII